MGIKRFIQMKLQHNKTDKSDAKMIVQYAREQTVHKWHPNPVYIRECKDLHTTINLYFKQSTALKNKLHSLIDKGVKGRIITSLKRQLRQIQSEIKLLEQEIESRVNLSSILKKSNLIGFDHLIFYCRLFRKKVISN